MQKTNKPLAFANVCLNYTTIGVQADENGYFHLSKIPLGEHELVSSFVGHIPYQFNLVVTDTVAIELIIKLSPVYTTVAGDKTPDYHSTIYWNPNVFTDAKSPAQISFYAADVTTKYRIVVEGITTDGIPLRTEKILTIGKETEN